jgi:excisionase family DNA binding protein
MATITTNPRNPRKRRILHTLPSAAEYMNGIVTVHTLEQWVWKRKIESCRIGGRRCIPEDVLDRLIDENMTPVLEEDSTPHKIPRTKARVKKKEQTNAEDTHPRPSA